MIKQKKLKHHWRYKKFVALEEAQQRAAQLKETGTKIVTVNGAFDLLHAGHLDFLEEARHQGDVLFVGLNSDRSVRDGKGLGRPIVSQEERAALLAALSCVDYIITIEAPYREVQNVLLRAVRPHVHVNGSEYGPPQSWIEWPVMQEVGAEGYSVERRPGLATSDIIQRIKKL